MNGESMEEVILPTDVVLQAIIGRSHSVAKLIEQAAEVKSSSLCRMRFYISRPDIRNRHYQHKPIRGVDQVQSDLAGGAGASRCSRKRLVDTGSAGSRKLATLALDEN